MLLLKRMTQKQRSGIKCLRDCEFLKSDFSRVLLMLQLQNFTVVGVFFLFLMLWEKSFTSRGDRFQFLHSWLAEP